MIYLIDRGFRIKRSFNILVNQCKCPGMYNECLCSGCKGKVEDEVKDNHKDEVKVEVEGNDNANDNVIVKDNVVFKDKDNDNDNVIVNDIVNKGACFADDKINNNQRTCFADDNVIANDNADIRDNVNDKVNANVIVNNNDNVNDNDNNYDNQVTCFADDNNHDSNNQGRDEVLCSQNHEVAGRSPSRFSVNNDSDDDVDKFIHLLDEKHKRGKPIAFSSYTRPNNDISINVSGILQS